jgi:hypothetical protein
MPAREFDNSNFEGYRCFALKIEMFKKVCGSWAKKGN